MGPYSSLDVYINGEFDQSVEMTFDYSQITQILWHLIWYLGIYVCVIYTILSV